MKNFFKFNTAHNLAISKDQLLTSNFDSITLFSRKKPFDIIVDSLRSKHEDRAFEQKLNDIAALFEKAKNCLAEWSDLATNTDNCSQTTLVQQFSRLQFSHLRSAVSSCSCSCLKTFVCTLQNRRDSHSCLGNPFSFNMLRIYMIYLKAINFTVIVKLFYDVSNVLNACYVFFIDYDLFVAFFVFAVTLK